MLPWPSSSGRRQENGPSTADAMGHEAKSATVGQIAARSVGADLPMMHEN
jgi:hypothetical protein